MVKMLLIEEWKKGKIAPDTGIGFQNNLFVLSLLPLSLVKIKHLETQYVSDTD